MDFISILLFFLKNFITSLNTSSSWDLDFNISRHNGYLERYKEYLCVSMSYAFRSASNSESLSLMHHQDSIF
ncbi:hypothetical protein BpHYR1_008559, partial [Brachionus plicatilis]